MPKAVPLTPALVETPQPSPAASTPARAPAPAIPTAARPVDPTIPLQLRLPRSEVRAIKKAALEADQTISDYMLACFHASM